VAECCEEIDSSLDQVSVLLGQLVLIRAVQQSLLTSSKEGLGLQWPAQEVMPVQLTATLCVCD
jgi:hypothetical protein